MHLLKAGKQEYAEKDFELLPFSAARDFGGGTG